MKISVYVNTQMIYVADQGLFFISFNLIYSLMTFSAWSVLFVK